MHFLVPGSYNSYLYLKSIYFFSRVYSKVGSTPLTSRLRPALVVCDAWAADASSTQAGDLIWGFGAWFSGFTVSGLGLGFRLSGLGFGV